MHATIALCLMMVGGPVPPEPEITRVPLQEDLATSSSLHQPGDIDYIGPHGNARLQENQTPLQELEYKERVKKNKLPRVPTIADDTGSNDRYNRRSYHRGSPQTIDQNTQRPQQGVMPTAPTEAGGEMQTTGNRAGPLPSVPGAGMGQGYGGQSGYSPRNTAYDNGPSFGRPVQGGQWSNAQTTAPRANYSPNVANTIAASTNNGYQSYLSSLDPNPMNNLSTGGGPKPFQDYQRPSGYSPWMSLYNTPSNNGTVSPYSASVQPQLQQQQTNAQMAEQIRGVQSNQMRLMNGVGGTPETSVNSGAGMTNPNAYLNYGGTYQGGR